ncbi:MAG: host attachment protein [Hyphomicrobiaceae bacterium]|nr:host attachment protein [Hyphomicrobiaceae bacterium]
MLIADGSRAKVMETDGRGMEFRSVDDMTRAIDLPKGADILSDRPGRTFESAGAGRSAKENPTDPRRHLKREFAATVVAELRKAMLARRFDRLILVAPPAFLGDLRAELPKDLKDKIAGDAGSDLTNTPEQDLRAHLQKILEGAR